MVPTEPLFLNLHAFFMSIIFNNSGKGEGI